MYQACVIDNNPITLSLLHERLCQVKSSFIFHTHLLNEDDHIQELIKKDISLVIFNVEMISEDSLALCKDIRSVSDIAIVFICAKFNYQMIKAAMQYKISDILTYPYTNQDITASLLHIEQEIKQSDEQSLHYIQQDHNVDSERNENVIEQVKSFIHKELHQQITLKQISKALHFNYAYLGQKFKNQENVSFNEYLLQQRMERAKQLLQQTDLKIYEIAQEVGYTEIDWFYKKFREYTGVSANEYRKKNALSLAN